MIIVTVIIYTGYITTLTKVTPTLYKRIKSENQFYEFHFRHEKEYLIIHVWWKIFLNLPNLYPTLRKKRVYSKIIQQKLLRALHNQIPINFFVICHLEL